jgi:hypothetical protein
MLSVTKSVLPVPAPGAIAVPETTLRGGAKQSCRMTGIPVENLLRGGEHGRW